MEQALVLMTVEPASEKEVLDEIRAFPGVREANFIYGPYDIYLKIEADTMEKLRRLVLEEIRNIKGVRSTTTCFIAGLS